MSEQPYGIPSQLSVELPPETTVGVPADMANIWHTPESFVLDFMALKQPPIPAQDEAGNPVAVLEVQVVARVRMPPTHVIELLKALERQLSAWETENGRLPDRGSPHPDLG